MTLNNIVLSQIMKAQEEGAPLKVYRKVITGKVVVRTIDTYTGNPTEMLIPGTTPTTEKVDLEVPLWTPYEVSYFEKNNKSLIESGVLIPVGAKSEVEVSFDNALTDEQITEMLTSHFLSLKGKLEKITSETTLQRVLTIAEELNRPAKTLAAIKARLEELQLGE